MPIVVGILWGTIALLIMFSTEKYGVPKLKEKYTDSASSNVKPVYMVAAAVYVGVCGYFAGIRFGTYLDLARMSFSMLVLASVFIFDWVMMKIPNYCTLALLGAGVVFIVLHWIFFRSSAMGWTINCTIALFSTFLVLFAMSRITKGGLGMGDVKILTAIGFVCGIHAVLFTLLFSFLVCVLASTGLLALKKKGLKDVLPLGPFIMIGFGIAIILGTM